MYDADFDVIIRVKEYNAPWKTIADKWNLYIDIEGEKSADFALINWMEALKNNHEHTPRLNTNEPTNKRGISSSTQKHHHMSYRAFEWGS